MSINVKKAIGSKSQTVSLIDVTEGLDLTKAQKKEVSREAGEYLVERILESVSKEESPISGEGWKKTLSPKYKEVKDAEGATLKPNMELTGSMLNQLQFQVTKDGELKVGIIGDRAWIADGHNKFSDASDQGKAPKRRFLPGEGQKFDSDIAEGLERIIADKLGEFSNIKKSELNKVESKSDLWDFLKEKMEGLSRSEIRQTVLRNEKLVGMFKDLELTDWLK